MTPQRRAFTLIEMLITIAIILILASLVIIALGGVRAAANRTETTSALRNMLTGFNAYTADNNQRLLPGYISANELAPGGVFENMQVFYADGVRIDLSTPAGPGDASAYIWRLAPYVDFNWRIVLKDYRNRELIARFATEYENGIYGPGSVANPPPNSPPPPYMGVASTPSIGMNAIFVGGDDVHGGNDLTTRSPWGVNAAEKVAATRYSEVKNPSRLIVFAPCESVNTLFANPPVADVIWGYPTVRGPEVDVGGDVGVLPQWQLDPNNKRFIDSSPGDFMDGGGVPTARWGKGILPVGHLDASVTLEEIANLSAKPKLWDPFATGL